MHHHKQLQLTARIILATFLGLLCPASPALATVDPATDEQAVEWFETRIRPVLVDQCIRCHGPKRRKAGLRLDSREAVLRGGERGPAVVPGNPDKSPLMIALQYLDPEVQMPPSGRLDDRQIDAFAKWIEDGAPYPGAAGAAEPQAEAGDEHVEEEPAEVFDLEQRRDEHWCYRPVQATEPPTTRDAQWPASPIDAFLLARLESEGLTPAAPAGRRTLIRRVYLDLLGFPPTPEEVEDFVGDSSPTAYDTMVDRLLESPHFGERFGRHWLDLMGFAETRGFEFDFALPNTWHYRDYVIRALNNDVPYDRFVTEHIAGDLLEEPRKRPGTNINESILATGFWYLGEEAHSPVDTRADEAERVSNRIDVLSKAFLGLTVSCARCHDHKFDAISTRDFYSLYGFLQSSNYRQVRFESMETNQAIAEELEELKSSSGTRTSFDQVIANHAMMVLRDALPRFADHLLAAAEAHRLGPLAATESPDPSSSKEDAKKKDPAKEAIAAQRRRTEELATKNGLDTDLIFDLWQDLRDATAPPTEPPAPPENIRVLVDYGNLPADGWITNGPAFGTGPTRAGCWIPGTNDLIRMSGVAVLDAATLDPRWNVLEIAAGNESEPGSVNWTQAGRTLRTPTFELGEGRVYSLVQGAGHIYVAIDSHRLVHGPLHQVASRTIGDSTGFRWIEHDLSDYIGHGVHFEFTPAPDEDRFAVARIVQADTPPDLPVHRALGLVGLREQVEAGATAEQLTATVDAILAKASDAMDTFRRWRVPFGGEWMVQPPEKPDLAELAELAAIAARADWLVDRAGSLDNLQPSKWFSYELDDYRKREDDALSRIARVSRTAAAIQDGTGVDERVMLRGSHRTPGDVAHRRFLEAIDGPDALPIPRGSGRLELARRMVDEQNPLIARVLVNRVWHHLFGRGIVASVDNFGVLGEAPSHPELLDWLAHRFVENGWSIKTLVRDLVTTRAYRMSSERSDRGDELDPENRLLHRMSVRRLEAEAIRDSILKVAGTLDTTLHGPSVPVHLTEFMDGRGRPKNSGPLDGNGRRSIYVSVRRNFLSPFLSVFDAPTPSTTIGRRTLSNVPAQSLALMNDPFVVEQANRWAERVLKEVPEDRSDRVRHLYEEAFSRVPSSEEVERAADFLEQQAALHEVSVDSDDPRIWSDLCHVLFNVKEFSYRN